MSTPERLEALLAALLTVNDDPALADKCKSLVWSIRRKLRFVEHHRSTLERIDWDAVPRVGSDYVVSREPPEVGRVELDIRTPTLRVRVTDNDAAMDLALITFDGAVSCIANVTDTLGRLLRLVYGLNLRERDANLFRVRDCMTEACPVGLVLHGTPGIEWLGPIRKIRGECQHADIVTVLEGQRYYAIPESEPRVSERLADPLSAEQRVVNQLVSRAASDLATLIEQLIDSIAAEPSAAVAIPTPE